MNTIRGTWRNGQFVPDVAVDWPEGCRLLIEREPSPDAPFGVDDDAWSDASEAFADWLTSCDSLEKLVLTPEEACPPSWNAGR